jgi:hypothetical protein
MPKPLKVKIFMGLHASAIEDEINTWLAGLGSAAIIKMETVTTAAAGAPYIVVTVWYEPQSN